MNTTNRAGGDADSVRQSRATPVEINKAGFTVEDNNHHNDDDDNVTEDEDEDDDSDDDVDECDDGDDGDSGRDDNAVVNITSTKTTTGVSNSPHALKEMSKILEATDLNGDNNPSNAKANTYGHVMKITTPKTISTVTRSRNYNIAMIDRKASIDRQNEHTDIL